MEPMDIVGKAKEDASLPKATMTKIIKEMLPPDVRVARDAQDLLIECCVEFINLISSESNEVCGREERRTIAPEHVLKALEVLGFGEYIEEVCAAYEQHRLETVDSVRVGKCSNRAEMTEEEAAAEQQRMFAEARARMNGGVVPKQPDPKGSHEVEMTAEEAAAEQQRMFAEARARMNGGVTAPKQPDPMCSNGAELRREEAVSEQQRFFAEAFARMNGVTVPPKLPEMTAEAVAEQQRTLAEALARINGGVTVPKQLNMTTDEAPTEQQKMFAESPSGDAVPKIAQVPAEGAATEQQQSLLPKQPEITEGAAGEQQRIFAEALARKNAEGGTEHQGMFGGALSDVTMPKQTEMTAEEAATEQQRMFAEAVARANGGDTVTKQPNPEQLEPGLSDKL